MGNTFFIGWELWQQMTFVLACSIILVFVLGLAKLWWTNRLIRRLELEDAEKKARQFDIQHCGIDHLRVDEIPFGVRAIQRGVEVEGIWISRMDTPDLSQVASSATLIGDQTEPFKYKSTAPDTDVTFQRQSVSETSRSSGGISGDAPLGYHSLRLPSRCSRHEPVTQLCVGLQSIETHQGTPSSQRITSYVPRGARNDLIAACGEQQLAAKNFKERGGLVKNHYGINKSRGY